MQKELEKQSLNQNLFNEKELIVSNRNVF